MYRIYTHPSKWWWWFTSPKSGHSTRFVGPKRIQITFYRRLLNHQTPLLLSEQEAAEMKLTDYIQSIYPSIHLSISHRRWQTCPNEFEPLRVRTSVSQPRLHSTKTRWQVVLNQKYQQNTWRTARERWHNTSPVCTLTEIQSSSPQKKMIVIMYIHLNLIILPVSFFSSSSSLDCYISNFITARHNVEFITLHGGGNEERTGPKRNQLDPSAAPWKYVYKPCPSLRHVCPPLPTWAMNQLEGNPTHSLYLYLFVYNLPANRSERAP